MEGPLAHVRVIDLTRARAGPTAVRQLSEMGAQVIRVEAPDDEDGDPASRHHYDFQNLHPNKRSLALDLKAAEGRALLLRLVEGADVLVENMRPAVKRRLGIDYEALSRVNPRLVYVSISGFGQEGPLSHRPGLDQIAQGLSGMMTVNGEPGRGPMRFGLPVADLTAGFMAAHGAVCALLERERSGRGQWVHTSLLQAAVRLMDFQAVRYLVRGEVPGQAGNFHPIHDPVGVYRTRDASIVIQASGQRMFERLCRALGAPELLDDPRYEDGEARLAHRPQLTEDLERRLAARPAAEWVELLAEAGVPAGPVLDVEQCFDDEQVRTLPVAQARVEHPELGALRLVGPGVNLERTPAALRSPAPEPGEHTEEILRELGCGDEEVAELRRRGVVR